MIKPEEAAPDFTATIDSGEELRLSSSRGKKVALGVCVEKKDYGCSYTVTTRTTFVIAAHGSIARVVNNVKVNGHAEAVLASA